MDIFYYKKERETDYYIKKSLDFLDKDTSIIRKNGKPYGNNCFIGVTHTEDFILVAVEDFDFGIDCESLNRIVPNKEKIADRYFTENERAYINEDNTRFLEIWVKKEAYTKYTGEGLSGMKNVDILCLDGCFKKLGFGDKLIYVYTDRNIERINIENKVTGDIKNT